MNRRVVNNAAVSLAQLLAETNAEADAEVAQLQAENAQLRAALGQREAVVKAARELLIPRPPEQPGEQTGPLIALPLALLDGVRQALKGCP